MKRTVVATARAFTGTKVVPSQQHQVVGIRYMIFRGDIQDRTISSSSITATIISSPNNNDPGGGGGAAANYLESAMLNSTLQLAQDFPSLYDEKSHCEVNIDDQDKARERYKHRRALSKAITLIESKLPKDQEQANLLLQYLQHQRQGKMNETFRLGIAGPPGAGKSTLIEILGTQLLLLSQQQEQQFAASKVAVVCIDPSSTVTGGSILGDKTRMPRLSTEERAYVRPSANGGTFGGLSAYTDDVVTLCKAAQYDFIIVETVGLGQSEVEVSQSVDMLMLIVPPSGGDELQGIKKGILEVADVIVVNKADGTLLPAARRTAAEYLAATRWFRAGHVDWPTPPVLMISAETKDGLDELWTVITKFRDIMKRNGYLDIKRKEQAHYWMWKNLQKLIADRTTSNTKLRLTALEMQHQLDQDKITPRVAAIKLMESLLRSSS